MEVKLPSKDKRKELIKLYLSMSSEDIFEQKLDYDLLVEKTD
jgi:hypothetical protein